MESKQELETGDYLRACGEGKTHAHVRQKYSGSESESSDYSDDGITVTISHQQGDHIICTFGNYDRLHDFNETAASSSNTESNTPLRSTQDQVQEALLQQPPWQCSNASGARQAFHHPDFVYKYDYLPFLEDPTMPFSEPLFEQCTDEDTIKGQSRASIENTRTRTQDVQNTISECAESINSLSIPERTVFDSEDEDKDSIQSEGGAYVSVTNSNKNAGTSTLNSNWKAGNSDSTEYLTDTSTGDTTESELNFLQEPIPESMAISYPNMSVSDEGILIVNPHPGILIEMTIDRAIRITNFHTGCIAATNVRGSASCIIHPGARIYHHTTSVEMHCHGDRAARISTGEICFKRGQDGYTVKRQSVEKYKMELTDINFGTANNVFRCSSFGAEFKTQLSLLAAKAHHIKRRNKVQILFVNGCRIKMTLSGDCEVTHWPKRVKMQYSTGEPTILTHFARININGFCDVQVERGSNRITTSGVKNIMVSNEWILSGLGDADQYYTSPAGFRNTIPPPVQYHFSRSKIDQKKTHQQQIHSHKNYLQLEHHTNDLAISESDPRNGGRTKTRK